MHTDFIWLLFLNFMLSWFLNMICAYLDLLVNLETVRKTQISL